MQVEITFITEETHVGKVTFAVNDRKELLGKHYHSNGLSWNMPRRIRYNATLEEWKTNVLAYK